MLSKRRFSTSFISFHFGILHVGLMSISHWSWHLRSSRTH